MKDASTGRALMGASITLDSTSLRTLTDSLGYFRLRLEELLPAEQGATRALTVHIRYIGKLEVVAALPDRRGYFVEASLASAGFHADEVSTVRVRGPVACERAP